MAKLLSALLPLLVVFPFVFAHPQLREPLAGESRDRLPVFTEIAKQAGVAYRITCGDEVTDYLIDVNGQGAAFLDYDNDGDQDLYLANGSSRKLQKSASPPHDYLLRNNGNGTFADVTAKAGLGDTEWSSGVAVGDFDNDGYLDLYVTNFGPNKLYRNNGKGTFSDVSEKSGVAGPRWDLPKWSMGAAFGDYDNDGWLDLYVANFARFNYQPELPPPGPASPCRMKGVPIACAPDKYEGTQDLLYHNNGDGTFTDVSEAAGITRKDPGRGFAVVFSDFDNDGDQDLYVANDAGPNFYYINDGKGKFKDASLESGTAVDEFGNAQGSMGLTVGDYNRDGLMDIFVTNFIDQRNTIYQNMGAHQFQDVTTSSGIGMTGVQYSGWGTKFFDFDNDGWLDLFFSNGHTMEQPEREFPADTFAEPSYLMRNMHGRFVDVSADTGIRKLPNKVSRGTAFGDIDNDGDIDMIVIHKNDVPYFLRNDGGSLKNWITLRTEGVKSNRAGIGTRVVITAGKARQTLEVRASDSYLSSNDLRVHAGLAQEKAADLEVRWPSGKVDRHPQVAANRHYWAREGGELRVDPRIRAATAR
jgi:enediyne biosynthesis protein E4